MNGIIAKAVLPLSVLVLVCALALVYHWGRSEGAREAEDAFYEHLLNTYDMPVDEGPDHLMQIANFDEALLEKGQAIYAANCVTCHGKDGQLNVAGARKFGQEPFQNNAYGDGANPISLFDTLANGWASGAMPAQSHLSASEKYAVIHYVRETFVKGSPYYRALDEDYLAELAAVAPAPQTDAQAAPPPVPGIDYPHPAETPVDDVVYRHLALRAEQTAADSTWARSRAQLQGYAQITVAADLIQARDALVALAGTRAGAELATALAAADQTAVIALLRQPTTLQLAPALAALTTDQIERLLTTLTAT